MQKAASIYSGPTPVPPAAAMTRPVIRTSRSSSTLLCSDLDGKSKQVFQTETTCSFLLPQVFGAMEVAVTSNRILAIKC